MKVIFMPKTTLGRWAVWLGIVLVIVTVLEVLFAIAIKGNSAVIDGNPLLLILTVILSIVFTLTGPLSFIVGVISIIKNKEWLVCKSLAILYVLTFLVFLLGEFLFPH